MGRDGHTTQWFHAWVEYRDGTGRWKIADASESFGPPALGQGEPGSASGSGGAGSGAGSGDAAQSEKAAKDQSTATAGGVKVLQGKESVAVDITSDEGREIVLELVRRADAVLESGRPVVVDGCFRSREQRARVRALATGRGLPFRFVEARVPVAVQRERLRERSIRDGEPDRTWIEIAEALRREWEPPSELDPAEHLVVDTTLPLDENVATLREALPTLPARLTG